MSLGLLTKREGVTLVQAELREQGLDGWLLYEFHGINPVAVALLGLGKTTRRGFVLIPTEGEPVALVVADDPYVARDALDRIDVVYEPLPACSLATLGMAT